MSLPYPRYQGDARRELVTEFRGLDVTDGGGEGGGRATFSDMQNGSTAKYPFAASREARKVTVLAENACALHGGEVLCRVQPPYLYYGDRAFDLALLPGEKQILMMGTDILIFPDAAYFDTLSEEHGSMDSGALINGSGSNKTNKVVSFSVMIDGKKYANTEKIPCKYETSGGDILTSLPFASLTQTDYFCIDALQERVRFSSLPSNLLMLGYDGKDLYYASEVYISTRISAPKYAYNINTWSKLDVCEFTFTPQSDIVNLNLLANGTSSIYCGNEYVDYTYSEGNVCVRLAAGSSIGDLFTKIKCESALEVKFLWRKRNMPVFDYAVVHDNRLFGCRYGIPYDGSTRVNRLYASALGNYKAFEQFQGISTDSWYGDVGEEGAFTGACISPDGRPMFFKEDYAYVLYGDYPPYSYSRMDIRGVAEGAAKSLAYVDGALYWKSRHDIMRYTGSSLAPISMPLGDVSGVRVARAGAWKSRYYVMLDGVIYVYDAVRGLWSKEDAQDVQDFAEVRGRFYILASGGMLYALGDAAEEAMPWSLTSAPIGYALPNRKYVTQLRIRIELAEEATVDTVEISTDGGAFVEKNVNVHYTDADGKRTGTVLIPIRPRRCETFRYRLTGTGAYKLTGVTKVIEEGGI